MQTPSDSLALLTDLYEFTMAEAYYQRKMFAPATFSLFIRDYPTNRGYFVSAGLEDVLAYLTQIEYCREDLDYLNTTGLFSDDFLHYLSSLRFSGDVHAISEGRLFFKDEPVLKAVMKNGERLTPPQSLDSVHECFQQDFKAVGDGVKAIESPDAYPVEVAPGLQKLQKNVVHAVIEKELGESYHLNFNGKGA